MLRPTLRLAGPGAIAALGFLLLGSRQSAGAVRASGEPPAGVHPAAAERVATFAGGCFWSMQKAFDGVGGVASVLAGYAGGTKADPTYQDVETGETGHAESVEVRYDPARISYEQLLDVYWHHIDPLTVNSAFCDYGPQYRSIIFYHDADQRRAAEASKRALDQSHRFATPIVTAIQPATPFYRRRSTTRCSTRRTRSATRRTGSAAGGTPGSSSSGATWLSLREKDR